MRAPGPGAGAGAGCGAGCQESAASGQTANPDPVQRSIARLAGLVRLYEEGRVRLHIRAAHRFTDAALPHRALDSGHGRGRLVLSGW